MGIKVVKLLKRESRHFSDKRLKRLQILTKAYVIKLQIKHYKLGVDLGLNHSAVCSVINSQGTVVGGKFINQPIES